MIGLKLQYKEGSISAALQNKHYLLEAITEVELEAKPLPLMLRDAAQLPSIPGVRRVCVELLRTHQPVEVVKFVGMKKYKADWWAANLRLEPTVPTVEKDVSFLLVGWSSEKYATKAVLLRKGSVVDIGEELERRVEEKINNGYTHEFELLNAQLRTGIIDLPEIPGLPPIKEEKKASFSEILGRIGAAHRPEPEPEPGTELDPEPEPQPKIEIVAALEPELKPEPVFPSSVVPGVLKPTTGWEFLAGESVSEEEDPEKIDLMDASIPHAKAKKIVREKKEQKEEKKIGVLELMKKRQKESDW